jgi:hypothetical protein
MVTVPVCQDCNKYKGKLDEYVRDVLVLDIDCSNNAAAQKLLNGEVARAIRKNRSEVARIARMSARLEPHYTPGGIYLGDAVSFPINGERMNQEFSLIARGLYYAIRKQHLPKDCLFEVRRIHPLGFNQVWEGLKKIGFNGPYKLGDRIFTAIMMYAEEDHTLSQWWLWFYESICVSVATAPPTYDLYTLSPTAT